MDPHLLTGKDYCKDTPWEPTGKALKTHYLMCKNKSLLTAGSRDGMSYK